MKIVSIDIGNTRAKAGIFIDGELRTKATIQPNEVNQWAVAQSPDHIIISSVSTDQEMHMPDKANILGPDTSLPIKVNYKNRQYLGSDRIAAATGAWSISKDMPLLVIDAGTCITYDLVHQSMFEGGAISPGINMRFKSLHAFTSRLPLVERWEKADLTGRDTSESLQSGVLNGVIFESQGFIDEYSKRYPGLEVMLTGGDAHFLAKQIKSPIFADPDLVLKGLYHILIHNIEQQ